MLVSYFALVVMYFLFGYLFLPDEICATGWYFGGAVLFPFVVFAIIGTLIEKGIIKPPLPKEKGQCDSQQSRPPSKPPPCRSSPPSALKPIIERPPVVCPTYVAVHQTDGAFEDRLFRARTEPLKFIQCQYLRDKIVSADIHNDISNCTYHVTPQSCTCEDFRKRSLPCKHMIYLSLQVGDFRRYEKHPPPPPKNFPDERFIPYYYKYYSGPPTGIGYKNLYPYRVIGRIHGISKKTGRSIDRKKEIFVDAVSVEDAQAAAKAMDIMPPYAEVSLQDELPSYNQLSYLHAVGVPFPFFVTADDVSALLTRYQEEADDICPTGLFQMATARRVGVSFFASPQSVISFIWYLAAPPERAALFCYAVYCRELGKEIGCAPLPYTDSLFQSFAPTEKQQLVYIKSFCPKFPIRYMATKSQAYSAAISHIRRQRPWLLP